MENEQIEAIMTKAVEAAYAAQTEETLSQLGSVSDAVQSAIDGIDFSEVDGMTEKEAYDSTLIGRLIALKACYKR